MNDPKRLISLVGLVGLAAIVLALPAPSPGRDGSYRKTFTVDGHGLYLSCYGRDGPVVVLDAGLGDAGAVWTAVQRRAAQIGATVCAYDRLGVGRSAGSAGTRTLATAAADLHALVRAAKLARPFVLVGHSLGGLLDRLYAKRYPADVSGLVLADAAPDTWDEWTGLRVFAGGGESLDVTAASASLRQADSVGAKPVVVLRAATGFGVLSWLRAHGVRKSPTAFAAYWDAAQRRLARISTNSLYAVAAGSDDDLPSQATSLVSAAIQLTVASARDGRPLPACGAIGLAASGALCGSPRRATSSSG